MGKSIIITGAGSGLGRALARQLSGKGHTLFLMGRTATKLEKLANELPDSRVVVCDVSDPDSVDQAFASVAEQAGHIDVLINNAGLFQPSLIAEASNKHIASILGINLAGSIYCARAAIPLMQKGSHILSIGSETVVIPIAMLALYQSSKAGLERFSQTLAQEVAPLGIRVTMVRAGKMYEQDMQSPFEPEVAMKFAEENRKLGIVSGADPVSQYSSAAQTIAMLLDTPADINIPHITLEGRFA